MTPAHLCAVRALPVAPSFTLERTTVRSITAGLLNPNRPRRHRPFGYSRSAHFLLVTAASGATRLPDLAVVYSSTTNNKSSKKQQQLFRPQNIRMDGRLPVTLDVFPTPVCVLGAPEAAPTHSRHPALLRLVQENRSRGGNKRPITARKIQE